MKISKLAINCFLGLALAACSASSGGDPSGSDGGKTDTSGVGFDTAGGGTDTAGGGDDTKGGSDTKTTTDTKTGTDAPPTGDSDCGAKASNKDCQQCCHDLHSAGYDAFVAALTTCGCKAGVCDTDCKDSVCASPPAALTATCNTCLNKAQSGACKTDLSTCATSGPCKPFFDCVGGQMCNSLP